jgi:hypothetical protein
MLAVGALAAINIVQVQNYKFLHIKDTQYGRSHTKTMLHEMRKCVERRPCCMCCMRRALQLQPIHIAKELHTWVV